MFPMDQNVLKQILQEQRTTNFILRAVYRKELNSVRDEIMHDSVMAAILEALADGPMAAGELRERVTAAVGVSERTVHRRLVDLQQLGVIERQGAGPGLEYYLTGLIKGG